MVAQVRKILSAAFGAGGNALQEDAWIDADATRTPREAMLRRAALTLQVGAGLNALVLVVLVILAALMGSEIAGPGNVLMANFSGGEADMALLLSLVGIGGNVALLLLLTVGTMAQEFWMWLLLIIGVMVNGAALVIGGFLPSILFFVPVVYVMYLAVTDARAFHGNPVSRKELRGRMRGVRAFAIITIFLTMMASFTVLLYLLQLPGVLGSTTIITGELGRTLFSGVVGVELALVIFIVPALTAGAITGERERKTFDLLQTTLLSSSSFLVGKLESALGYILLLLLSAIPLQSIAFLFGGVSEIEVLLAFMVLLVTALLLGAMGLFFSAWTDRTTTATVRVYTVAMALMGGLPFVHLLIGQPFARVLEGFTATGGNSFMEAVGIYVDMVLVSLNPATASFYSQRMMVDYQEIFLMYVPLQDTTTIPVVAPWLLLIVSYLILAGGLVLLAVRRMRRGGGS